MVGDNNFPMLSTKNNPFNPFVQFDEWKTFDEEILGYYTCSYLARIAKTSIYMTDEENTEEIERAIDEIVEMNLTGNYIKVYEKDFETNEKENESETNKELQMI